MRFKFFLARFTSGFLAVGCLLASVAGGFSPPFSGLVAPGACLLVGLGFAWRWWHWTALAMQAQKPNHALQPTAGASARTHAFYV